MQGAGGIEHEALAGEVDGGGAHGFVLYFLLLPSQLYVEFGPRGLTASGLRAITH